MRRFVLLGSILLIPVLNVGGQSTARPPGNDSLFHRARRMVTDGNGAAGRALVDSLLKGEPEGSKGYGDALYWHGALAETAVDAERDYRRVIVEYPLSTYADDALLAIAELEQARGDRVAALQHLQRFVKEHPSSAARGTAAFAAARLAFEQRDVRIGCTMLAEARASIPGTDVELHNQIDYFSSRCPVVASAMVTGIPAITPVTSPARDTASPASTVRRQPQSRPASIGRLEKPLPSVHEQRAPPDKLGVPAAPVTVSTAVTAVARTHGMFTIQLAAYSTRIEADRLVAKLRSNGMPARVSGSAKPFRVRLAFFSTRQEALDEVALLKRRGIIGFVTTEEPPAEEKSP